MTNPIKFWTAECSPYDRLPLGVCLVDRDFRVCDWNSTLSEWTGVDKEEALGINLAERYPSLKEAGYACRLQQVFETGQPAFFSAALHRCFIPIVSSCAGADGTMVQQTTVDLLEIDSQRLARIMIEDVTGASVLSSSLRKERDLLKQAMEEIQGQSEELSFAHAIVQSSQDAIVATSLDGIIRSWNHGAQQLFQYDKTDVLGTPLSQLVVSSHVDRIETRYRQLNRGKRVEPLETIFTRQDGRPLDVTVTLSAIRDTAGQLTGVSCIAHDIGETKRAENDNAYLSAIVESSEDAVIGFNLSGEIAFWNQSAERIYGYTAVEAIGQPHSILSPHGSYDEVGRLMETTGRGERTDHYDTVRQHKDGHLIEVSLNVSPIRDSEGKIIGVSKVSRDISERKQIEAALKKSMQQVIESHEDLNQMAVTLEFKNKELAEATRLAEQASKSKGEFLANMSHEIRTPMTAILGYADLLLDEEATPSDRLNRVDSLKTIKRNGEYLLELINDILDISKIEAGKLDAELINCSPLDTLQGVDDLMRVRAEEKNLALEFVSNPNLPPMIQADPTRLRQVLINLVGNSIKFTQSGYIRVTTDVMRADGEQATLHFQVTDTGIGMTEDQTSRIFMPFTQADQSTTREFGGTGLGLTICKRLVEVMGGTISVASTKGEGTTFQFTAPIIEVALPESETQAQAGPDSTIASASRGNPKPLTNLNCRILLAEDGPDNQRLISLVLRKAGAEVELAENGQIAVDLAIENLKSGSPFDVILMDMQMPVLDGYGATRTLREAGYEKPIIALTAHAMDSDRQECLDAGCDDFASKPIDRPQLLAMIAGFAQNAESSDCP